MNFRNHSVFKAASLLVALATSPVWSHAGGIRQTQTESSSAGQAEGSYFAAYRTPAHVKYSQPVVFHNVVGEMVGFLQSNHVDLVNDPSSKMIQTENVISRETLLNEAKDAGASHLLYLTVDRPKTQSAKLTLQCFDLSGKLIWEETSSSGMVEISGKKQLSRALEKMKEQLFLRINQPGLQPLLAKAPPPVPSTHAVKNESSIVPPSDLTIEKGKLVSLLLLESISSKNLKVGDRVHFRVTDPVIIDHLVVVPRKAAAWGTVTAFRPRGRRLRSADVSITVNQVDLINGKPASLNAVWEVGGHLSSEHANDVALGVVQTYFIGLAFVPLMHGDEVVIPKGTQFDATFAEQISLDRAEIEHLQPPPIPAPSGPAILVYFNIDTFKVSPAIWCGKVKLGKLAGGSHYALQLPAGKYWVRTESKKNALAVMLEPGGKYFIRVSSRYNFEQIDANVGEVQVSDTTPLVPKDHQDFTKDDQALLSASPRE